ncbi:hypothetical protein BK134_07005 [Paenibacillus peoriae]|nr:hypothetical protein BK134_07005 [Paenibacillus peoriae]
MEFKHELVELLIENSEAGLSERSSHRFIQQPELLRNSDYKVMNENLFLFLDKFVIEYLKKQQLHSKQVLVI